MPTANFLLKLHFDEYGPSDSNISNLGGVSFYEDSGLKNAFKCAYFEPYNDNACLWIKDTDRFKLLTENSPFTIYMRYKIDINNMSDTYDTPILSYINDGEKTEKQLLFIQEKKYFSILLGDKEGFSSKIVDYTFDNKWHTLCITRTESVIRFFIDGCISTMNQSSASIIFGDNLYLGRKLESNNIASTFNGGYIDDFCILEGCIYDKDFIPPTLYFTGFDSIENYFHNDYSNIDNVEEEIKNSIEKRIRHSDFYTKRITRDLLPRRLRIKWYVNRGYFKNEEFNYFNKSINDTILSLYGLEIPLFSNERFFEENVMNAVQNGKFQAFMIFINKKFIKLSELTLIKSDFWTTVIIKGRNPEEPIKSVEVVTIPFPIIYEEGMGEREDIHPLYVFDNNGLFNPSSGYTYYYIDPKIENKLGLGDTGIIEQYIPSYSEETDGSEDGSDNWTDDMFMHNVWRYGTFELKRLDGNNALMQFMAWDQGWVKPGDNVILYKNTVMIDPSRYRIVGYDLIEFYDYKNLNLDSHYNVTMQIITDSREWLFEDMTTMKYAYVEATVDNQSVFEIPNVKDSDGLDYRFFLVFRGSVCIDNQYRYKISDDYKTITFTNTEDFVPKGSNILFVFVKLTKSDQFGPLHVKPVYVYLDTPPKSEVSFDDNVYQLKIPYFHNLTFTQKNFMMFIQDTFISPDRYKVENNIITTMWKKDHFNLNKSVVLVLFKIVNRFEDPINDHDRVIKEQIDQGKRFVLYPLNIDKKIKISLDNIISFDNNGQYIPDLFGEVYIRNIIKCLYSSEPLIRVPRYLTCIYLKDLPENLSNGILPTNDSFISEYMILNSEFFELDDHFKEFISNFNIYHTNDFSYGENLAKALDYIICYNQNKLDIAYEKLSPINRVELDGNIINNNLILDNDTKEYYYEMDKSKMSDGYYQSYPIIFVNGILPDWYRNILYIGNRYRIFLKSKFSKNDNIEILQFNKIHNKYLEKITKQLQPKTIMNIDVLSKLIVGNNSYKEINSKIIAMENKYEDILSSIIIVDFDLDPAEKDWSYDITNIITVKQKLNKDLIGDTNYIIKIINDINSNVVYGYPEYYEIYSKILPKYPILKDIYCSINIPKNIV